MPTKCLVTYSSLANRNTASMWRIVVHKLTPWVCKIRRWTVYLEMKGFPLLPYPRFSEQPFPFDISTPIRMFTHGSLGTYPYFGLLVHPWE